MSKLPPLEAIKVLSLNPGDVIVAEVSHPIRVEQAERLREQLAAEFPGHKIIITTAGISLARLIREDEIEGIETA